MNLWKFGCGATLIGMLVTAGSCVLFGTAARDALEQRRVAVVPVAVGADEAEDVVVEVDPEGGARIDLEATVRLEEDVVNKDRTRGEIYQSRVPANYKVYDDRGEAIHLGAGELSCSVIIPEPENTHFANFDPNVECRHQSQRFPLGEGSSLRISVTIPSQDSAGNSVTRAELAVFDRISTEAGDKAIGGLVSMLFGPVIATLGFVVFVFGLLIREPDSPRSPSRPSSRSGLD